jgi:hypothetical protein
MIDWKAPALSCVSTSLKQNIRCGPGVMAHIYNPSYLCSERSQIEANVGKKVSKTPSQPINWVWWHMPVIPAT